MQLKSRFLLRLPLVVIFPVALFACAGSIRFWQGWAWLGVCVLPMLILTFWLYWHDPQMIERRMKIKEKIGEQKIYQITASLCLPLSVMIAGLDYRFGWSRTLFAPVPAWLSVLADGGVLSGVLVAFWAMKVNSFAARTIQVEAGQPVVSTGPYGLVRHPMYLGGAIFSLSNPIALGSWIVLAVSALLVVILILRLLGEEKFLCRELPGYSEYCDHTRFRLLPYIW